MSSRKRTEFTLKKKKETIDAAKNEPNQCKLAVARAMSEKWEIDVKRTTVKGILSKKNEIKAAIESGVPSKRKKLKLAQNLNIDDGMLVWLKQKRQQNLPVSGDLIRENALKLAELLHIRNFTASDG